MKSLANQDEFPQAARYQHPTVSASDCLSLWRPSCLKTTTKNLLKVDRDVGFWINVSKVFDGLVKDAVWCVEVYDDTWVKTVWISLEV